MGEGEGGRKGAYGEVEGHFGVCARDVGEEAGFLVAVELVGQGCGGGGGDGEG